MTPGSPEPRPVASGRRVLRHLVLALVSTVAAPPLLAWSLHAQRETETRRVLQAAVGTTRNVTLSRGFPAEVTVTCGQGRVPDIARRTAIDRGLDEAWPIHQAWLAALARSASGGGALTSDAWAYCSLLRRGGSGTTVLLSAGANGLIETALDASVAGGDDILVAVD
jgi:hypothetical protein